MNSQAKARSAFFITVFVLAMFTCKPFQEESEKTIRQRFYLFRPETILDAIANGKNDVFTSITENDFFEIVTAPSTGSSVNWTQSHYFYIVNTFYNLMLHDNLADWKLSSMSFSLNCNEVNVGLQDGRFGFFKIIKNKNEEVVISRFIDIDSRYKTVSFWEREFYPYVVPRSSVEPAGIKFDSEKAIQIAEENGGRDHRLSVDNKCEIALILAPELSLWHQIRYGTKYSWKVFYQQVKKDQVVTTFAITIDPFTGDIH